MIDDKQLVRLQQIAYCVVKDISVKFCIYACMCSCKNWHIHIYIYYKWHIHIYYKYIVHKN